MNDQVVAQVACPVPVERCCGFQDQGVIAQKLIPVHRLLRLGVKQFFDGRLIALRDILFQLVASRSEAGRVASDAPSMQYRLYVPFGYLLPEVRPNRTAIQ